MKNMQYQIRKAEKQDLDAISQLYADIHTAEENGLCTIGWERGIYPERETAEAALAREDLFVLTAAENEQQILAAAIINQVQVPAYVDAKWSRETDPERVCVLHTLVVDPDRGRSGIGTCFVKWYEAYAKETGCTDLRMDTNERNGHARALYKKLGYQEVGIVGCEFNGIPGVRLVCLEKLL